MRNCVLLLSMLCMLSMQGCRQFNDEIPLAGDYILSAASANDVSIRPNRAFSLSEPHIPGKVVAFGWDERFIIAKQHPIRPIGEVMASNSGRMQYIKVDYASTNYWILDTVIPEVYGPFSNSEYLMRRESLGVPVHLKMSNRCW